MNNNYFFIDGSALTAQIRQLMRAEPVYRNRKLCPREYLRYLMRTLQELHGASYKRAVLYFPVGDEVAIEEFIVVPDHRKPGEVRDVHFKFCGHKLKKSAEFDKFVEENVPAKFHNRFQKSEKGIDIEICCDAIRLASTGRLERLFLFSNDGDFVPLCRTLKEFGTNVSILHLSEVTLPNDDLLREADSYDVVDAAALATMFQPQPQPVEDGVLALPLSDVEAGETEPQPEVAGEVVLPEPESEKPDAEPSDLNDVDAEDASHASGLGEEPKDSQ